VIDEINKNVGVESVTGERIEQQADVPAVDIGRRFDQVAAELFSGFSRARLQQWIKQGHLLVDGQQQVPKYKVLGGEALSLSTELAPEGDWQAEDIPLDIVFEDDTIIVINKSANFVVHPAAGNYSGTVLNALLHHCPSLISVPRAGIVHRLDKDTTGLMVVAKTLQAHTNLVAQLQARSVRREYEAVVTGVVIAGMPNSALRWQLSVTVKRREPTTRLLTVLTATVTYVSSWRLAGLIKLECIWLM
jgi:23S rRNA pseudouridine1911/1915/1917 synthase